MKDYTFILLKMAGNIAAGQGRAVDIACQHPTVRKREVGLIADFAVDVAQAILRRVVPPEGAPNYIQSDPLERL